ncbi:RluA family pseudouridine synthase [Phocaeicola salanitronis]
MARAAAKYTTYRVSEPGELMEFLMKKMAGISRTRVKALLTNRVVLVDNTIQTLYNYPLQPGMCVQISREKHKHEFHHPMLKILYEDAYIIVVEKKEGLLSVATERQKERTAQHILNEYVKRIHKGNRIYVVHRLDRETSGIMMYAKDEKTQHTLRDNWHDLVRDRRYVTIVQGEMEQDEGTVCSWLTDRKLYVSSSPTDDGGKYSVTHYHTIKRANGFSLLELQLETGRKNQIRVHMQSLGHPVVGDERYGCEMNPLGRLALHAFKLCFYHPVTHEWMEFETPYPTPFKTLMLKK